jgi:hypothetical protein
VVCYPSDSWRVAGECFSIPESVWTLDSLDSSRLRYVVDGLALSAGSACFVVRVLRGARAGERYLVGPSVVKTLMSRAMRLRAGGGLRRAPVAV